MSILSVPSILKYACKLDNLLFHLYRLFEHIWSGVVCCGDHLKPAASLVLSERIRIRVRCLCFLDIYSKKYIQHKRSKVISEINTKLVSRQGQYIDNKSSYLHPSKHSN